MMLTALLYAYATGMRSSRAIEAACRSDLAFRVICVNHDPHFTTMAPTASSTTAVERRITPPRR
jgi:transposase